MSTIYCSAAGCGSATPYVGVKPKVCPKCGTSYDATFAAAPPPVATPKPAPRPSRPSAFRKAVGAVRSEAQEGPVSIPMTPVGGGPNPEPAPVSETIASADDGSDIENDGATKEDISAYAQELGASLNLGDIIVHSEDEPVKFRDWVAGKPTG